MPRSLPSLAFPPGTSVPRDGPRADPAYFAAAARFAAFAFSCTVRGSGRSSTFPPAISIAARAPAVMRCTTTPSRLPRTRPACFSAAGSTTPDSPSRSVTWTSSSSRRWMLLKPNFGRRLWSGICPPSKPSKCMLPERAFWPLPPRPAVLPRPDAWPRPTRFLTRFAPLGAFRFDRDMRGLLLSRSARLSRLAGAGLGLLARLPPDGRGGVHPLPLDEVGDLGDHPHRLRRVGQDLRGVVLLEAEARDDGPVIRRNAREPADELHLDGSHCSLL